MKIVLLYSMVNLSRTNESMKMKVVSLLSNFLVGVIDRQFASVFVPKSIQQYISVVNIVGNVRSFK